MKKKNPITKKGRRPGDWLSFDEAKEIVRGFSINSAREWHDFCNGKIQDKGIKPINIPRTPYFVYKKNGWAGWGDWLGTGSIASTKFKFISFNRARSFTRKLRLRSVIQWHKYCNSYWPDKVSRPATIPKNPQTVYSEWISWGDWLGTGSIARAKRIYWSFKKARNFARKLNLKSRLLWSKYCINEARGRRIKPPEMPSNPQIIYKNKGWKSWGDWLGTHSIAPQSKVFLDYKSAKRFVRTLKISSIEKWYKYCRNESPEIGQKPDNIPFKPWVIYGDDWVDWYDWFGKKRPENR